MPIIYLINPEQSISFHEIYNFRKSSYHHKILSNNDTFQIYQFHQANPRLIGCYLQNREVQYSQKDQEIYERILSTITDKQKKVAIETIYKDPNIRKKQEIQQLIDNTSTLPFFEGYIKAGQEDIHNQCCRRMKLEVMQKGTTIFQVGEYGQKFYLILHGSVSVSIKMPGQQQSVALKDQSNVTDAKLENIINQIQSLQTNPQNGTSGGGGVNQINTSLDRIRGRSEIISMTANAPTPKQSQVQMIQVTVLRDGSQFGEMALLNNQPRLATIQCLEDCIFGILGKKDFKEVLKKYEEEKLHKEMEYFSNLPFFISWNINQLKNLFLNSRKREYTRDQYIFQEGDPVDGIYIIKRGDFQQNKKFVRLQGIDGLNLDVDEIKIFDENEHLHKFEPHEKEMQICILDEKKMIGEEDIIRNSPKRTFSVKCSSLTGVVIKIQKNEFLFRIMLEESSKLTIMKQLEVKEKSLASRIQDIKSRLSQFQNYFYQNSKHKEYIRYKIESQSSKLFQLNSNKKGNTSNSKMAENQTQEESKIRMYASTPFTSIGEFTTKTSIPRSTQLSTFSEAIKVPINKRVRSFSSVNQLKTSSTLGLEETSQKNPMSMFKSMVQTGQSPLQQQVQEAKQSSYDEQLVKQRQIIMTRPHSSNPASNYKQEKKGRSISSNETNIFQIMKTSLQDYKQLSSSKDDNYNKQNEIPLNFRQKPLEETQRPRLLYGNIEQTIKVNFKKVFQKKLREKGANTDIRELPTWNKVSMSFANQVLVYNTIDNSSKNRLVTSQKKKDYETLLEKAHQFKRELKEIPTQQEEDAVYNSNGSTDQTRRNSNMISEVVKQQIAEAEAKRKLIRSRSNPKTLIQVMRNFQSSQSNSEQSKLVEITQDNNAEENKTIYLKSVDYNSISRIHYSPKKSNSSSRGVLRIKKK